MTDSMLCFFSWTCLTCLCHKVLLEKQLNITFWTLVWLPFLHELSFYDHPETFYVKTLHYNCHIHKVFPFMDHFILSLELLIWRESIVTNVTLRCYNLSIFCHTLNNICQLFSSWTNTIWTSRLPLAIKQFHFLTFPACF